MTEKSNVVELNVSQAIFEAVMAYKGIHALCTTDKNGRLRATHYACCLIGGSAPIWGVWTARGKFLRMYGFKHEIASAYPDLAWRVKQGEWKLAKVTNDTVEKRRAALDERYGGVSEVHNSRQAVRSVR